MYNSQETADKISFVARQKKLPLKELLSACDLGINSISNMRKGQKIAAESLGLIAEQLEVSVDYLLGRTTVHEVNHGNVYNVHNSPLSAQGYNNTVNVTQANTEHADSMVDEMLKQFETLSFADKAEIMHIIAGKAKHGQA